MKNIILFLLINLLVACGNGSNNNRDNTTQPPDNPPAAFGLESRPSFTVDTFPLSPPSGSVNVRRVNAFPELNFSAPIFLTTVPGHDNSLAVLEQGGRIYTVENSPLTTDSLLMLDISAQVLFSGEQGLLGMAFDPNFTSNGYLYVYYSATSPRRSVISRFTFNPATLDLITGSEFPILSFNQPYSNHNGGTLQFGPDGRLYIASGDGGSGGDPMNYAQNTDNLLGKILRIDVHSNSPYGIPADNPFANGGGRPEIFAVGLRNPFRMAFDRQTGALWVGDVGQVMREEVNIVTLGGNYGWRVFEGNRPFDDSLNTLPNSAFTAPVHDYGRNDGTTVIGGTVYRGAAIPALFGDYVFADYGSGQVWRLREENGSYVRHGLLNLSQVAAIGEDQSGELYLVSINGSIYRLEEDGSNTATSVPATLSDTGLFANVSSLDTIDGLIAYEVNAPFYSDDTTKLRWMGIPDNNTIQFSDSNAWTFPRGSMLLKHFGIEATTGDPSSLLRLETRVLVKGDDGWSGYAYRWREDQLEADLLSDQAILSINVDGEDRDYVIPSRSQCLQCHNDAAGPILGAHTAQLNREIDFDEVNDNQLRSYEHIELLDSTLNLASGDNTFTRLPTPLDDNSQASLEQRARAYLAVNCAQCHRPGGTTGTALDLRYDTPLTNTGTLNQRPNSGDLGIENAYIIAPGDATSSILWQRMARRDASQMPPLGSRRVDSAGSALIAEWINSLQ